MKIEISKYIVHKNTSIIDALKVINDSDNGIAFVCDGKKLVATVSDGDVRRFLIDGGDISSNVSAIAHYNPIYAIRGSEIDYSDYMRQKNVTALPILDDSGIIVDIVFSKPVEVIKRAINCPVIIMAGGKGARLKPYTDVLPKPLIPIGDKTITEHIMDNFIPYGCNHFDVVVNYKKNFIKSYFADNDVKYDIDFVEESEFLGTAGGLTLISGKYTDTFFITNCDILIQADYREIYDYHKANADILTIVCAKKKVVIPYGTITTNADGSVHEIVEKPALDFITSTGFYVAEPAFLEEIPLGRKVDITEVIDSCIDKGLRIGVYLLEEESWLDMGQLEEMERMKKKLKV